MEVIKRVLTKIQLFNIYCLLIFCIFNGVIYWSKFNLNYLDEFIIILILVINILINDKIVINKKKIILLISYFLISIITLIIRAYDVEAYVIDLIYTIKPFILIEVISSLKLNTKQFDRCMNFFIILNTFSIFYGFYNSYLSHQGIYITNGLYRDWVYRIEGFSGHPANMASLCLFTIVYIVNKMQIIKNQNTKSIMKVIQIGLVLLNIVAIYYTLARVQLFALILYFLFLIYNKIKRYNKKVLFIILIVTITIIAIIISMNIEKILYEYEGDFENAIRFYAISKIPEVLNKYPILGTSLGSFSTEESIKNNSYVYTEFQFATYILNTAKEVSTSLFESNFAKQMIQTGLLGTLLYYSYFYILYKENKNNFHAKYWILFVVANSILNLIYSVQILVPLALIISNFKEENE